MAIPELAAYVRQARANGATDEQIRQDLLAVGWDQLDITNALTLTPTPEAQAVMIKPKRFPRLIEGLGRTIRGLFILFEVLILLGIIGRYVAVPPDHWLRYVLYLPTDWATVPSHALVRALIFDEDVFTGPIWFLMNKLSLIPGGSVDLAGILTFLGYGLVYLILASLAKRLYRSV